MTAAGPPFLRPQRRWGVSRAERAAASGWGPARKGTHASARPACSCGRAGGHGLPVKALAGFSTAGALRAAPRVTVGLGTASGAPAVSGSAPPAQVACLPPPLRRSVSVSGIPGGAAPGAAPATPCLLSGCLMPLPLPRVETCPVGARGLSSRPGASGVPRPVAAILPRVLPVLVGEASVSRCGAHRPPARPRAPLPRSGVAAGCRESVPGEREGSEWHLQFHCRSHSAPSKVIG